MEGTECMKTVYTCSKCKFTFERSGTIDLCPDCGSENVRTATEEEKQGYQENRDEFATEK